MWIFVQKTHSSAVHVRQRAESLLQVSFQPKTITSMRIKVKVILRFQLKTDIPKGKVSSSWKLEKSSKPAVLVYTGCASLSSTKTIAKLNESKSAYFKQTCLTLLGIAWDKGKPIYMK